MFISVSFFGFLRLHPTWTQSWESHPVPWFPDPAFWVVAGRENPASSSKCEWSGAGVNGQIFAGRKKHGLFSMRSGSKGIKNSLRLCFFRALKDYECSTGKEPLLSIYGDCHPGLIQELAKTLWVFSETPHGHRFQSKWCWARWGERPRWRPHFALGVLMPRNLVMERMQALAFKPRVSVRSICRPATAWDQKTICTRFPYYSQVGRKNWTYCTSLLHHQFSPRRTLFPTKFYLRFNLACLCLLLLATWGSPLQNSGTPPQIPVRIPYYFVTWYSSCRPYRSK